MAKFPDSDDGTIMSLIAGYGVGCAKVSFNGSCDSGQIEDIIVRGINDEPSKVQIAEEHSREAGEFLDREPQTLYDLIESFAYKLLERTNIDWYNNDGGFGTVEIAPGDGKIIVHMSERITTVAYSDHDYSIEVEPDA